MQRNKGPALFALCAALALPAALVPTALAQAAPAASDAQAAAWDAAREANLVAGYEAYLKEFPNGQYAATARVKLAILKAGRSAEASPRTAEQETASPKAAATVVDWGVTESDLSIQVGAAILGKALQTHSLAQISAAAGAGDKIAQHLLATAYDLGQGVPQDQVKKVEWLTKAAEQGVVRARGALGVARINGRGTAGDELSGWALLLEAARAGNAVAQYNAGIYTLVGVNQGNGLVKQYSYLSKRAAYDLLMQSAQAGCAPAEFAIGQAFVNGTEFNGKDKNQARYWLGRAAEHGIADAATMLRSL